MNTLPTDTLIQVVCTAEDFKQLRQVCSEWRDLLDSDAFYEAHSDARNRWRPRVTKLPLTQTLRFYYTVAEVVSYVQRVAYNLSDDAIRLLADKLQWDVLCWNQALSLEIVDEFADRVAWDQLLRSGRAMDPRILEKYHTSWKPKALLEIPNLSETVLAYIVRTCALNVCSQYLLSESFIEQHLLGNQRDVRNVCTDQVLSKAFMAKHADILNWELISAHQKLSDSFINEFAHKISWDALPDNSYTIVKVKTLIKYQDRVSWHREFTLRRFRSAELDRMIDEAPVIFTYESFARTQKLTVGHLRRIADRVNWRSVARNQNIHLTAEDKREFADYWFAACTV